MGQWANFEDQDNLEASMGYCAFKKMITIQLNRTIVTPSAKMLFLKAMWTCLLSLPAAPSRRSQSIAPFSDLGTCYVLKILYLDIRNPWECCSTDCTHVAPSLLRPYINRACHSTDSLAAFQDFLPVLKFDTNMFSYNMDEYLLVCKIANTQAISLCLMSVEMSKLTVKSVFALLSFLSHIGSGGAGEMEPGCIYGQFTP